MAEDRRAASPVLADVYALVQHEVVWASEAELNWTAGDRAMGAAQDADTPAALAPASATAGRLPGGYYHPWTMFGAANVKLHAVSISADLSRSAEARNHAEDIDPEEIPSRERRGRLGVEIARSYYQRRDYPAALYWLETAYATSADSVRYSRTARQMTADAVDRGGALISRRARVPGREHRTAHLV